MRILKFIIPAAVAFSVAPAFIASAFAGSDPAGIWLNDTGRGAVQIKPCGNAFCGNVVWVKSAADSDGCGKQVIGDVTAVGGGRWDNGWIYSPEKGRKYDVELTPLTNGNLKVVGYAGMKFLSKTMIWKPAPADLQLCGQDSANKAPSTTTASITPLPVTPNANAPAKTAAVPVPDTTASIAAKPNDKAAAEAKPPVASSGQPTGQPEATAKAEPNAPADDDNGGVGDLGKMKIGDLELDKVLSKTKDGKCKLDLPWIKVTIDCER